MNRELYAEAEQRYLSSDWAGAAELLEQVVAADPDRLDAWVMLGAAARQLRNHSRSAEAYERAVQLDPAEPVWRHHLVHVLEEAGRHDQAAAADATTDAPTV